ncbi:polysaccharide biosynthesis tyrosine autokinase [uncultured Psychrobacter sp.]|uniref:polysaccharide biosynthesis tyrosine autokinase n=1 Tax=uncultured Psychrobacter sp. TaxID=259303 RepID=UPI002634661A|nr:polysaccharide biosynthesis tyrosine autokinase [uncultured Psychrobacter sp.]
MKNTSKSATENDNDIDLLALFLVLLRGWKIILFFALLGLLLGVLYTRYVNPTFRSDALIQIEEGSQGVAALGENISNLVGSDSSTAQTEAELIRSRMVLEPVVDALNLRVRLSDPTIGYIEKIKSNRTYTQINTAEEVTLGTSDGQVVIKQFDVSKDYLNKGFSLVKSENGFTLTNGFDDFKGQFNKPYQFNGTNGQIRITVAQLPDNNHPVNIYKQSLHNATNAINGALSVVEKGKGTGIIQLTMTGPNQQQTTSILSQVVQSYFGQNQARGSEETTQTLEFMETQIPVLREKLEKSEAKFNEFREQSGTIDVTQESQLLLAENARIDAQLSELKLKKADLTTYYTEEHPLVIQINDQIEVLNNRKQQIKNTIQELPEIQREFLQLSEDVGIDREIYLTLLKNYQQLQIAKAGQLGYARIIDMPISTFRAIAPKKLQIWLLSMFLGTLLGAVLALIKSLLRNVVKDPERLEEKTGVPVVATIPRSPLLARLDKNKASRRLLAYTDRDSLSYEAIKSLRTSIMFGMPEEGKSGSRAKVVLITGESPGVGKSFVSSNLSEVFAQLSKKVLVIDADMRLGELHKVFNMTQDNGLADYFQKENHNLQDVVHPTTMENIDFIPRGEKPHNPSSLLSSEKFSSLMKELSTHYDYIVIDSPPVLAASDAMILAQYADKVLMVTRYDDSIEGQLVYATKQMQKANVNIDGIVLNDVRQGLMSKYSYHYSYAYGHNK